MSGTLLLEIGLEEVPARYVRSSSEQLKKRMENFLDSNRIEFGQIDIFGTPRRLAVIVRNLSDKQEDLHEKAKGPAKKIAVDSEGNWTKAALGFAKGQGVSAENLYFEELKGIEYVYANKEIKGLETNEVLKRLPEVIDSMSFPITMHWGNQTYEYIRPIHWIVSLLDDQVIPFSFLTIDSGRVSRGHRFLGQEAVIDHAESYSEKLKEQFVIADLDERKQMIIDQIHTIEKENNWIVPNDDRLMEEVVSLVEFPTAFYGTFDEKYLSLPEEVLITSMKDHQRYFEVTDSSGKLLPYFISVRNGNAEHIDMVKKGNRKVLTARLEDALFFFEEDQKQSIDDSLKKLENVSFHAKIGSIAQKTYNTGRLAESIADFVGLPDDAKETLRRAARVYNFDLVTNMVGEFPELQGIMGEKYALLKGENPEVAVAIREHFLPLSSDGALPETKVGAILAVADKLDSIISFFKQDMIPTGSNDPYALRRQMIGVVQIIEKFHWTLPFREFLKDALLEVYSVKEDAHSEQLIKDLIDFAKGRVQQKLQTYHVNHDIQDAIMESSENDLLVLIENGQVIYKHQKDENYKETIEALARVVNISHNVTKPFDVNSNLFETNSEKNLHVQVNHLKTVWKSATAEEKYTLLQEIAPYIHTFFDENMVMVENLDLRENRLNLLANLTELVLGFADVRKLITK
ncbi:MAG TPA: glycine--tRNA ligase subunit beta [Candidatus Jeotgalibaca pullicola]|nr:glycine--tRNA ligase subunit beta [Candidatus Jeotgalibaca pullicola]